MSPRGRRFKKSIRDPEHLARVGSRDCRIASPECWGQTDAHHEPALAQGGDDHHVVPLCQVHHGQRHRLGPARFNERHHIDLRLEAVRTYEGRPFVEGGV